MVGILVSLRDGLFSGANWLVSGRVYFCGLVFPSLCFTVLPTWRRGFASEDITPFLGPYDALYKINSEQISFIATSPPPVGHPLHGALERESAPHKWPEQFRFRNYIPSLQLNDGQLKV